jgi:hypothetical protein
MPLFPEVISKKENAFYLTMEVRIDITSKRRGTVLLTIPKIEKTSYSSVLCIHGHGGTRRSVYEEDSIYKGFASELAKNGYITISMDVGQHITYENETTLMGERLWGLIRCVDYLETLQQADPNKIGCAGLSLGGEMAMWLGAMDERIKATVSSGFLTSMDQLEKGHCPCWRVKGIRKLVDFSDIYSLIAPRALMCQIGIKEKPEHFPLSLAKPAFLQILAIYKDFGKEDNLSLIVHKEGHVMDVKSLSHFLDRYLN